MKRNYAKKGFTIVELIIVIAVVAILAGTLIPTFSSVVEKANQSKALQECNNELLQIKTIYAMSGEDVEEGIILSSGSYAFKYENGKLNKCDIPNDKKPTKLKNVTIYSTTGVSIGSNDLQRFLFDCINLSGLTSVNTTSNNVFTITVRNDEGVIIYKESGDLNDKDQISFDIYSNESHLSGNKNYLTKSAPKSDIQSYGKYYTYIATNGTNTLKGIFYYSAN